MAFLDRNPGTVTPAVVPLDPMEEFFAALARTPRDWQTVRTIWGFTWIRRAPETSGLYPDCPIVAVFGGHCGDAHRTAAAHGIPIGDKIVSAADGEPGCDPAIRQRLLQACGL